VYHYHSTDAPPYIVSCYGPVASVAECRGLYSDASRGCGGTADTMLLADEFGVGIYEADVDTVRCFLHIPVACAFPTWSRTVSRSRGTRCVGRGMIQSDVDMRC
jgi:hypothetical protein